VVGPRSGCTVLVDLILGGNRLVGRRMIYILGEYDSGFYFWGG